MKILAREIDGRSYVYQNKDKSANTILNPNKCDSK